MQLVGHPGAHSFLSQESVIRLFCGQALSGDTNALSRRAPTQRQRQRSQPRQSTSKVCSSHLPDMKDSHVAFTLEGKHSEEMELRAGL